MHVRRDWGHVHFAFAAVAIVAAACSSPAPSSDVAGDSNLNGTDPSNGKFGGGKTTTGPCVKAAGNYDIPGDGCDNDGNGKVDDPPSCDGQLSEKGTAADFAKAIGVCATTAGNGYGLVDATFTRGYGRSDAPKDDQHGVLAKFGNVVRPREGARLGVISTGFAQEFDGASGTGFGGGAGGGVSMFPSAANGNGSAPPGFPKAANGCDQAREVNDVVNVKLRLKAPANATGFKFDFNFHSSEWPDYICSRYNDGFIAYLTQGSKADNISFDAKKNPVSVNNGFFDRCTSGIEVGCAGDGATSTSSCPGGPGELAGTGFGLVGETACASGKPSTRGGATGWLTSSAPVSPGEEFTLELMIWDAGDGQLDSSVLLDNFQWIGGAVTTGTVRPPS